MKKGLLLLLTMFVMVSSVEATEGINPTERNGFINNRYYDEAVSFVERGIQFHIFLNGEFDFNSRNLRNRRVRISRDFRGRINRVGNVFIRYDFRGNVRRIGSVNMNYNRGRLTNVGNLRIRYNRWGDPRFYGQVRFNDYYYNTANYFNSNISVGFDWNIGTVCVYNDPYFYGREFRSNYRLLREDDNFFYYRANNDSRVSRAQVLKRKKPSRAVVNTRRANDSQVDRRLETKRTVRNDRVVTNRNSQVIKRETNKKRVDDPRNSDVRKRPETKKRIERKREHVKRENNNTERRRRS